MSDRQPRKANRQAPTKRSILWLGTAPALVYLILIGFCILYLAADARPSYAYNAMTVFAFTPIILGIVLVLNSWLFLCRWKSRATVVMWSLLVPTITLVVTVAYIVLNWRNYPTP